MQPVYWFLLFVLLLGIEICTMGLTTIWFAGGALVAMVVCMLGGNIWLQCIAGLAVAFLLLLFTRPFAVRYINRSHVKTNADSLVGQTAQVTEAVNNLLGTGKVQIRGQEWTARTREDGQTIDAGTPVQIEAIEGVKLIVKEKENE